MSRLRSTEGWPQWWVPLWLLALGADRLVGGRLLGRWGR